MQISRFVLACLVIVFSTASYSLPVASAQTFDERLDSLMDQDPPLPNIGEQFVFPDELVPLWIKSLNRSEIELRRLAADSISLAHRYGAPGLQPTGEALMQVLQQDAQPPVVLRAVARALVELDERRAAAVLFRRSQAGAIEVAQVIEPALAKWNFEPIRDVWLQRLENTATRRTPLLLAIEGVGTTKEQRATEPLLRIVESVDQPRTVRLAAARSLGQIHTSGLTKTARELVARKATIEHLLAAVLSAHHSDDEAIGLLQQLATDVSPAVAAFALRRLFAIDPSLVFDLAEAATTNQDVNVRRVGAQALVAKADDAAIKLLRPLLDDPNPKLRRYVSQQLIELAANSPLRDTILAAATKTLSGDDWRGLEQSLIVLATLDHEPAMPRFVELLTHRRTEVAVSAAWGLRRLAVTAALPAMLRHAQSQSKQMSAETEPQLSHLFQAFGAMKYAPAEPLLRSFAPKSEQLIEARAAAIWALGHLYQDQAPADLTKLFAKRLADTVSIPPEDDRVRKMSAISIGRMRGEAALPTLREFSEGGTEPGLASGWAVERITGEKPPPPVPTRRGFGEWFLMSIK